MADNCTTGAAAPIPAKLVASPAPCAAGSVARRARPIGGNPSPPTLRLLPRFVCKRTVVELERLLVKAIAGEVVGIAYSVAMPGLKYGVNAVGAFADDPTYARGTVAALDDELRYLVQEAADHEPPQEF